MKSKLPLRSLLLFEILNHALKLPWEEYYTRNRTYLRKDKTTRNWTLLSNFLEKELLSFSELKCQKQPMIREKLTSTCPFGLPKSHFVKKVPFYINKLF